MAIAPWTHVFLAGQPRGRRRAARHPGSSCCFRAGFLPSLPEVSIAPRGCGKCAEFVAAELRAIISSLLTRLA